MFDARNRIKEHFKCSRTDAEVLLLLMEEGFRTYSEFRQKLFISPAHLRKRIVVIRKKGFEVVNVFGIGYAMSAADRRRIHEAANRP